MTEPTGSNPLNDMLLGVASNIAYDLLKAGSSRLAEAAFGDAEQRALHRVYQHAIYKALARAAPGLDELRHKNLAYLLDQFMSDPRVANVLIDCALLNKEPSLADLETRFNQEFDSTLMPISFKELISSFVNGLKESLPEEATRPNSPLFNRVNLGQLAGLRTSISESQEVAAQSLDILKRLDAKSNLTDNYAASAAALGGPFDELTVRWVKVGQELEQARTAWREGHEKETLDWIRTIKSNDAVWPILIPVLKGKILQFEASAELDTTGNIARVKELADEAKKLAPAEDQTLLRAHIARRESGPETAISILDEQEGTDGLNLKAAFLLEMGRIAECQALLDLERPNFKPNAETYRVRALAYFLSKDLNRARLEIAKALELEPRWEGLRFVSAMINYHSALSPVALPDILPPWPEPVDWTFVRRDNESILRLREAEKIFGDLAKGFSESKEQRFAGKAWRLACMANDPERQEEATEYCRTILATDSTHWPAIVWTCARNYAIDLGLSQNAIEKLIADGTASLPQILAQVASYLKPRDVEKALAVLGQTKPVFVKHRAEPLWVIWQVQALVASGAAKAALAAIDDFGMIPELRHVHAMAIIASARADKDVQPAVADLEQSYAETGDARFLFEACDLMARQENWSYVADRAEQLVNQVQTSEALRLAVIASFNAQRFEQSLSLLDHYNHLCKDRTLPKDLRQIRVRAQYALGILPAAIKDAEDLVKDDPTERNLLNLAQLYFAKGDLKRLAIFGRQCLDCPQLGPESLLHISEFVRPEDRKLAEDLWKKASSQSIPDALVIEAINVGFRLGFDHEPELRTLMARMMHLGNQKKFGIEALQFDEAVSRIREEQERIAKVNELYRNGEVPIHLVANVTRNPLAIFFHGLLSDNEENPDPARQVPVLICHGGRAHIADFASGGPKWRVHLDITAVLLAAHLEILPAVERAFRPLFISEELQIAIANMRESIAPHQVSRLHIWEQVLASADRGSLAADDFELPPNYENAGLVQEMGADWVALYEQARATHGYVLCFLPPTQQGKTVPATSLPPDAAQYLVDCHAVLDSLRTFGPLSENEYADTMRKLGAEGDKTSSGLVPKQNSPLYCFANTPRVVADAGMLHAVCERFQVRIQQSELAQIQRATKDQKKIEETVQWLDDVRNRISQGIDAGTYQITTAATPKIANVDEPIASSPEFRCLYSLFAFEPRPGDVIWIDDRFTNGFTNRDGIPLIGINEVLKALVAAGALTQDEYYQKLTRLRAANVAFIPVEKDEILNHLQYARIERERVIETRALKVLRSYINASLLRGTALQRPNKGGPNPTGESEWVMALNRAILDAIQETWADRDLGDDTCQARSQWILDSLHLDLDTQFNVMDWPRSKIDARYAVALSLAELIGLAIQLLPDPRHPEQARSLAYLAWLDKELLQKRFATDSSLPAAVSQTLKSVMENNQRGMKTEYEKRAFIYLMQQFYEQLPEAIRTELWRDTEFMSTIGVQPMLAITAHGLHFRRDDFYRAAVAAINGHQEKITPVESNQELIFQPDRDQAGQPAVSFEDPVTGEKKVLAEMGVWLLANSVTERERVLREYRHWFDGPKSSFDSVVAEIASLEDPIRRVEVFESWRKNNAVVYYAQLHEQMSERQEYQFDAFFPPNLDSLVRFLRIEPSMGGDDDLQQVLSRAAQALAQEEGLLTAVRRFVGLPIPLPEVLLEHAAGLAANDVRDFVKKLIKIPGSPISRFHLIRLLVSLGSKSPSNDHLARQITRKALDPRAMEGIDAFLAILRWTDNQFESRSEARTIAPHLRLVLTWAHAHELFSMFVSARIALSWVSETFGLAAKQPSPGMFHRDPDLWYDVACPIRVDGTTLVLMGLAYGVADSAIVDNELRKLVHGRAFVDVAGIRLPVGALLHDMDLMKDSLDSFLGGDRAARLNVLLGEEATVPFTSSNRLERLRVVINALDQGTSGVLAWPMLFAILGDLPPRGELAGQLKSILLKASYVSLYGKSQDLGYLALHTAALQTLNLHDEELRSHLKTELVEITKHFAHPDNKGDSPGSPATDPEKQSETILSLLQLALDIALASPIPDNAVVEFADLIGQLIEAWRAMIPTVKVVVRRLCDELPRDLAQHFWTLHVRLRAS